MFSNINYTKLLFYTGLCQVVGIVAGLFTANSVDTWFATLNKPSFNPPSWLFAPVWTTLYLLMGISAYMVDRTNSILHRPRVLASFYIQLALNFLWSFSFFYLENPLLGLINIVLLWIMIIIMINDFRKINTTAAYLQIPYLLWVSFATVLNYSLYTLN